MPYPPQGAAAGITKLSQLEIDTDKDWGTKRIQTLGPPDTGNDAARDDTIDGKIVAHEGDASAHHPRYTDAEADARADAKVATHETGAKHRWTLNKLRKGAGAGADPTEIDVPSAVTFTELAGGEDHLNPGIGWGDWDLSGIIGAGAVCVLLAMQNKEPSIKGGGARKNGSALARFDVLPPYFDNVDERFSFSIICECDANRVIEIYGGGSNEIYFQVLGYWS